MSSPRISPIDAATESKLDPLSQHAPMRFWSECDADLHGGFGPSRLRAAMERAAIGGSLGSVAAEALKVQHCGERARLVHDRAARVVLELRASGEQDRVQLARA